MDNAGRSSSSTPATTDPVVRLRSVSKHYPGAEPVRALREVSATFLAGTFTAVMGPSGSGKSTLLHCAAGLDRPTSGEVWLEETALAKLSEKRRTRLRRTRVGFVFQAFNLLPALTVEQNIALPLLLDGRRPDPAVVADVLHHVGLAGSESRRPAQLSGGQQQRVAIARALAAQPSVVFADEPTGALDRAAGHQVLDLLRSAVRDRGRTVIMVTHDPVAAAYADTVLYLADGRAVGALTPTSPDQVAAELARISTPTGP